MKLNLASHPEPGATANSSSAAQAQARFKQGMALHDQGQLAQAQALYHQVLKLEPRHFDALHLLGVLAGQTNHPAQAIEWIRKAIKVNPNSAVAHSNLGNALSDLKRHQAAIASYDKAIAIKPDYANAYANRGKALYELGQLQAAIASYDKAIAIKPDHADAYCNRGLALHDLKQYQAAIASYDKAIVIKPNHALAHCNRGVALYELKQHQAAVASYDQAIAIEPNYADAYSNRGNALHKLGQHQVAIDSYDQAIAIKPDHAEAYYNRGLALNELKQHQAAIESFDHAIAIQPDHAEACTNRGVALYKLKQYQGAIDSYDQAIAIQPDHAEAYASRGVALYELKQHQAAIDSYDRAIAIQPDHANAYANRANALNDLKQNQAAIDSYDRAVTIDPDYKFIHGMRLGAKMQICDWSDAQSQIAELMQKIEHDASATPPFFVLALTTSLPLQRKAAEIWVREIDPPNFELGELPKRLKGRKIRIGYFSMDFRTHPVSVLTAGLFESHDRDRFEVYAFSFGPDTKDEMRVRLEAAFDRFINVENRTNKEIAELARQMEIDIAIDLAGFTSDSRSGIFALRAAPLQVNYLGYPGTMGADYIDYLIADRHLIPEENRRHYAEKIAYLPSFQANDSKREIADKLFTREELGLPRVGFVFCCFSNNYKITPGTFDGWMRILKKVEGSVLFLYAENEQAATNLREEGIQRGVEADRLVFGKKLPAPEYLARYRAADLFLDTLPFNAGTTASDALWAGLPVLTCTGETFASRMAGSLLSAIDLPELVASTQGAYEALAVELATHPERLNAIKEKLERNRLSTALFDTKLFTKHIEDAYTQMVERYDAGLAPDHIYVGKPSA